MADALTFEIKAKDGLSGILDRLGASVKAFGEGTKTAGQTAKVAFSAIGNAAKDLGASAAKVAEKMASGFQSAFSAIGKVAKTAFKGMAVGAAAAAAGIGATVKAAGSFDLAMREVWTLTDWTQEKFEEMGQTVIQLSSDVPDSASTMASALYSVVSAGREGADMFNILDAASKLGVAGLSDTSEALGLIVSMMNSFGMESKDAMKAADLLFTTIQAGQTQMSWLTQYAPALWPTAATLGIDPAEIQAMFASLTLAMGEKLNPRAVTGLVGALNSLYGMKISDKNPWKDFIMSLREMPPLEALEKLRNTVMKFPEMKRLEVLRQIIPEKEAAMAVGVLVNNWDSLQSVLEQFRHSAGKTEEGFGKMSDNIIVSGKILLTNIQNVAIQIGNIFVPAVKEVISFLSDFAKTIGNIDWKSIWDSVWGDPAKQIPQVKELFTLVKTEFLSLSKELEGGGTMPTLMGDMIWSAVDLVAKVAKIIWIPLATEGEILIDKLMLQAKAAFFDVMQDITGMLAGTGLGKRLGITKEMADVFGGKAAATRTELEWKTEGGRGVQPEYERMREQAFSDVVATMEEVKNAAIEDWARIRATGEEVFGQVGQKAREIYGEAMPAPEEQPMEAMADLSPQEFGGTRDAQFKALFAAMDASEQESWRKAIESAQAQITPTAEGENAAMNLISQLLGVSMPEGQQETHRGILKVGDTVVEIGEVIHQNQLVFNGQLVDLQGQLDHVKGLLEEGVQEQNRAGAIEQTSSKSWGFAM